MSSKSQRRTADSSTDLYAQVQRLARPGAAGEASWGTAGVSFAPGVHTAIALMEVRQAIEYPGSSGTAPYSPDARIVWLAGADCYGGIDLAHAVALYFPTLQRIGDDRYFGLPPLGIGGRCHAWFNRQSGRWEAISPPALHCRFEMTTALDCGGVAEATAFRFDAGGVRVDEGAIIVYDAQQRHSKMATTQGDPGALGMASFMPDLNHWEITAMQTPGDFWGTLQGDLGQADASQTVALASPGGGVLDGYNVFGANHGTTITAFNPTGGGNGASRWLAGKAGDRVFCRWDIHAQKYWILAVEPNRHDWQTLDVVVRTSLAIDFDAKTFTQHDYTRRIEMPPWAVIGEEVQR